MIDAHGILERVLVRRYGQPELEFEDGLRRQVWGRGRAPASTLYYYVDWSKPPALNFAVHRELYGACCGGILVSGALKVTMLSSEARFGIYNIHELEERAEIKRAAALDPTVAFFMDAGNVWFYGHRDGKLFVYDSETGELDDLGPIEPALEQVIAEWETSEVGGTGDTP